MELEQAIKRCIKTEEKYRELKDMIEGMTLRENSEDVDKFKLSLQQEKATTNELYRSEFYFQKIYDSYFEIF